METAGNIYLTHSSFITATAAVFTLLSGFFLVFLKKKSKATIDLATVFISISFTSIAFTFAFVYYHHAAAYHRWLTVTPVLIGILFLARFFFHFPTERAHKFVRVATIFFIAVALADGVLWIFASLKYGKVFHGESGMWDLAHSHFAAVNAAIIGFYILLVIAAGIWRIIITPGRDRYRVLSILSAFIISTIIPGIANSMARQGAMELNTFILTYATMTIIGWFITLMLYINYTTDYIPFMVRIVGICVITFLLCLVGISYVIAVDMNGNITLINHVAQKLTGWAFHEAIGEKLENIYQILDETDLKPCRNSIEIILNGGMETVNQQRVLLCRDGSTRFVYERGTCMRDNNNMIIGAVLVFHDITEEKKHQIEMVRMRLLFKQIIDSMPSILIGIDQLEKIIYWNSQAEKFTSLKEQDVSGRTVFEVLPFLKEYIESVQTARSTGQPQKVECIQAEKNGNTIKFEMTAYPLIAADMEGAVIRLDDVTARLRMEEMIIQTEKMVSLGGLAAGMAHEINNPLGGIMMGSQNILRRIDPSLKKNHEYADLCGIDIWNIHAYMEKRGIISTLQGILEMGGRASEIVENMLSFSRKSESAKSSHDLKVLAEKAIELASNEYDLKKKWDFRHLKIIRDYDDDIPQIPCVKTEIQQVILNLLKNAAYALGEKTYEGFQPQITIRLKREHTMVCLDIADNGIGMDTETKKRVFEPFFTTKEAGTGTGLGLSVSYFIITNNHGGQMEVESVHGVGTTFSIRLPIS